MLAKAHSSVALNAHSYTKPTTNCVYIIISVFPCSLVYTYVSYLSGTAPVNYKERLTFAFITTENDHQRKYMCFIPLIGTS